MLNTDEQEQEELSYSEIYSAALLNEEVILTILPEDVDRVKIGLKNFKAKQATKMKEDGLVPDPASFTFTQKECHDPNLKATHVDLSIQLTRKSTIKVAKITIPDSEF